MTEEKRLEQLLRKSHAIGQKQAAYSMWALLFGLYGMVAMSTQAFQDLLWIAPLGISLEILAWFGQARAAQEVGRKIRLLASDYNYGEYGGAPPFIWALAYAPHGQGGFLRVLALLSYPVAFAALLAVAWHLVNPYTLVPVMIASWLTLKMLFSKLAGIRK